MDAYKLFLPLRFSIELFYWVFLLGFSIELFYWPFLLVFVQLTICARQIALSARHKRQYSPA